MTAFMSGRREPIIAITNASIAAPIVNIGAGNVIMTGITTDTVITATITTLTTVNMAVMESMGTMDGTVTVPAIFTFRWAGITTTDKRSTSGKRFTDQVLVS